MLDGGREGGHMTYNFKHLQQASQWKAPNIDTMTKKAHTSHSNHRHNMMFTQHSFHVSHHAWHETTLLVKLMSCIHEPNPNYTAKQEILTWCKFLHISHVVLLYKKIQKMFPCEYIHNMQVHVWKLEKRKFILKPSRLMCNIESFPLCSNLFYYT